MRKVTPSEIRSSIIEEALKYRRKKQLFESVKAINSELKQLNEVGMVGSFGFKTDSDVSNKTTTGFESSQNISHIAQLEKEMAVDQPSPIKEDVLDEVNRLKEELAALKQENEQLKSKK